MIIDNLGFFAQQGEPQIPQEGITTDVMCLTAAPPFITTGDGIIQEVRNMRTMLEAHGVTIIQSSTDFDRPGVKALLGLQAPPEIAEANALLDTLETLKYEGVQYMTLAYQGETLYAGGFLCPLSHLSKEGENFVRMLGATGIALDLAHAGHTSALEALEVATRQPVLNSHTGVYEVFPNMRNHTIEVLKKIADKEGIVGLYNLTFGLHQRDDSFEPFREHLMYLLNAVGEEAIAWGSDSVHKKRTEDEWRMHINNMQSKIDSNHLLASRFPDVPSDLSSPENGTLVYEMIHKWLPVHRVNKFIFQNALCFWKNVV